MTETIDKELSIKVVRGGEGFEAIYAQWLELAKDSGDHYVHFPGWYKAALAEPGVADKAFFVCIYRESALVAVIPLERVLFRLGFLRVPVLQLLYPSEMGVNDAICTIKLYLASGRIEHALRKNVPVFLFIRWQSVPGEGFARSFLSPERKVAVTHWSKYLDFSDGFDAFWDQYNRKFTKGIEKKYQKANSMGNIRLVCATEMKSLPSAFEEFLEVEKSGWKGEKGTSVKQQPAKLQFYTTLLNEYGQLGLCQINLLYLDDVVIAAQFCVRVGNLLQLLKIGFREEYAELSPGYLIIYELLKRPYSETGINKLSFVTGVDWIDRWKPGKAPIGNFYSSNGSWYSRILASQFNKKSMKKHEGNMLPDGDV